MLTPLLTKYYLKPKSGNDVTKTKTQTRRTFVLSRQQSISGPQTELQSFCRHRVTAALQQTCRLFKRQLGSRWPGRGLSLDAEQALALLGAEGAWQIVGPLELGPDGCGAGTPGAQVPTPALCFSERPESGQRGADRDPLDGPSAPGRGGTQLRNGVPREAEEPTEGSRRENPRQGFGFEGSCAPVRRRQGLRRPSWTRPRP